MRVAVAAVIFSGLTAALVDFRGLTPPWLGRSLADLQFIPSLVALLAGAGLSLACNVMVAVTLAAGRIYCSTVCPLGILQDLVIFLRKRIPMKASGGRYRKPHTIIRQGFLSVAIAGAVMGLGGFTFSLLDPYSLFGRMAAGIFRPLVTTANNALAGVAGKFGGHGLYRVEPLWVGAGVLAASLLTLLVVGGLAAWRGRLYCNSICPVGTLLGLLAERAAWRLRIHPDACRKCGDCLRACKAQCIELRSGRIDFSRCVACYDCLDVCRHQGIGYQFMWAGKNQVRPAAPGTPDIAAVNPQRRAFLAQAIVGAAAAGGAGRLLLAGKKRGGGDKDPAASSDQSFSSAISPPGAASQERFLQRCTACHLCVSACPTGVLRPAFLEFGILGLLKPRLDYQASFCNFDCRRCGEVCPSGAISLLPLADKQRVKIGEARFDQEKCVVVTKGTDCAACSEHCPTKAVFTKPYGDNLRLPEVNAEWCIGCGACEFACPVRPERAIVVYGLQSHGVAKQFIEPQATLPGADDFPF